MLDLYSEALQVMAETEAQLEDWRDGLRETRRLARAKEEAEAGVDEAGEPDA
jgi:hypothetical protein